MLSQKFTTTANYVDSQVYPEREVTFYVSTSAECEMQTARINPKDGSLVWDQTDNLVPAMDMTVKAAGVRFRDGGGGHATVYVIWTYEKDDCEIVSFSDNI